MNSDNPANVLPIPFFWEPNFWEPTVQLALRDYCRPGDVAYDVGANACGLSLVMSRHVGPRGIVCSFEASPRIIDKSHRNLVESGCSNVYLYHRAVFSRSHETVTIFPGTHLNDSIYNDYGAEGGTRFEVETLALDDFYTATGLLPSIVKMDIEGAEYDALLGARHILEIGKPKVILEQSPSDMRCHELLTGLGYIAVDLARYCRIAGVDDFEPGVGITNILFVHRDHAAGDPYVHSGEPELVATYGMEDFVVSDNGSLRLNTAIELPPGRYVCKADFSASGTDNEIYAGIDSNHGRLMQYHTYTKLMCDSYHDWVFAVAGRPLQITPYLEFIGGSDPTLEFRGAKIYRYASFDGRPPAIVF